MNTLTTRCATKRAGAFSAATIGALVALSWLAGPALGQAVMRPKNTPSKGAPTQPATQRQSPNRQPTPKHHRFHHKPTHGNHLQQSTITYLNGGLSISVGNNPYWCSPWGYGGYGVYTLDYNGPYAVYYGSSGLRQIGPTFDQIRTYVPATSVQNPPTPPEPTPPPTPEERLLKAIHDRSYSDAQVLARQQGNQRLEAFALLGRGQVEEAANMLARAYRANPELYNQPLLASDLFASDLETRKLLGFAVRYANRQCTAEAWFLVSTIMQAQGRYALSETMLERARQAEREQRGVVPRPPQPAQPAAPTPPAPLAPSTAPATPPATPATPGPSTMPAAPTPASPPAAPEQAPVQAPTPEPIVR